MSRAARRRASQTGRAASSGGPNRTPLWIMSGSVAAALIVLGIITQRSDGSSHHPTPRLDAHAAHVMPAARYEQSPRVAETYAMAAEMPGMLDGVFCYCYCHNTFGHYSLLDCFMDDHAATCDVCLNEAVITYEMTQRGEPLEAIRTAVDERYRT